MFNRIRGYLENWVYAHRAQWTARRIAPFVNVGDRVLDVGAGDCQLDEILRHRSGCEVVAVDVTDSNRTSDSVILYDGQRLPFADKSFDVVLLIFVLHHTSDPGTVLEEAQRVSRTRIIAFEDINKTWWDRITFRVFHRWLKWSRNIDRPFHEWSPKQWSALGKLSNLHEHFCQPLGRQLSYFASRHVGFVWHKEACDQATTTKSA